MLSGLAILQKLRKNAENLFLVGIIHNIEQIETSALEIESWGFFIERICHEDQKEGTVPMLVETLPCI